MKISFNWLKEYFDTDYSAQDISKILTDLGLEVEKTEYLGLNKDCYKSIVTGKVIACEKHQDAEKLKVTKVDIGSEILQIVCGAPNVEVNQYVAVALVGSCIYPQDSDPVKIKKARIRGVDSFGMICSQKELGLSNEGDGIWIIDNCKKEGESILDHVSMEEDCIFEIGLTPNRSDALGITGVARDLSAYLNFHKGIQNKVQWPDFKELEKSEEKKNIEIELKSEDCLKYAGISIVGVKVDKSPLWMQDRLSKVGINTVNNIVDITNYVMMELGTPLHAFDAEFLEGKITVQHAEKNTLFSALDGNQYTLSGDELMITNGKKPLCIAGVMGGVESGIQSTTTNVFLESAIFDAVSVRKTAKSHSIHSDASFRFERGVDPSLTQLALNRAAALIMDIAGGKIGMDPVCIENRVSEKKMVSLNFEKIRKQIGHSISDLEIEQILTLLDISVTTKSDQGCEAELPHYRQDVTREADVIEEVLRIYGYNNIPLPSKMSFALSSSNKNVKFNLEKNIAQLLVSNGYIEAMNNSLGKAVGQNNIEQSIQILNPLSQDLEHLRTNLLEGLLTNVAFNQNRQNPDLKLFEFGKTYFRINGRYEEHEKLALIISGVKEEESWNNPSKEVSLYTLKSHVERIFEMTGITLNELLQNQIDTQTLELKYKGHVLAQITVINKETLKRHNIKNKVYFATIDIQGLLNAKNKQVKSKDLPKSFMVRRDFALLLDKNIRYADIVLTVKKMKIEYLMGMNLFDVYEGENLDKDKKSYAISFHFQDPYSTLQDQQIDKAMNNIYERLNKEFKAILRQ